MSETKTHSSHKMHSSIIQFENHDQQIIEFHKLGLLGSVLSSIIHELNQPLTSMSMDSDYLTIISQDPAKMSTSQILEVGQGLQKDVQRSQKILDELRSFTQRNEKTEEVNLNSILNSCLTLTKERIRMNGITCKTKFQRQLPKIVTKKNDLQFALLNLILNSCNLLELFVTAEQEYEIRNFIPEIAFETSIQNFDPAAIQEYDLVLELSDNGLSLTSELSETLQKPYIMMKIGKRQLLSGLYLTKMLVEKNNGTFKFGNRKAQGFEGSVNFYEIKFHIKKP